MGPPGGLQEFNFIVPTGKTGLIIGKGMSFKLLMFLSGIKYSTYHQIFLDAISAVTLNNSDFSLGCILVEKCS